MNKFYLIDNDILYLSSLESQLRAKNYQVFSNNGDLGLKHTFKDILLIQPEIIIMDLVFPSFDGTSLLHQLQEEDCTNDIPIAVYTLDSNKYLKDKSMSKGVEHFFIKENFEPQSLLDRIYKIYKWNNLSYEKNKY